MYVDITTTPLVAVDNLPESARLIDGGAWVMGLATAPVAQQEATGWFVLTEVAAPTVQPTQRAEVSVQLVNNRPTQVWTVRAETAEELSQRTRSANLVALKNTAAVQAKMADLKLFLTDVDVQFLLDLANNTMPSAQQLNRGLKAIIRQERRAANFLMLLARLELARYDQSFLDDITDT